MKSCILLLINTLPLLLLDLYSILLALVLLYLLRLIVGILEIKLDRLYNIIEALSISNRRLYI
jgi:hypothetical protein